VIIQRKITCFQVLKSTPEKDLSVNQQRLLFLQGCFQKINGRHEGFVGSRR
jgi:hypothetical protein